MKRLIFWCLSLLGFGAVSCEEFGGGGNLDAYGTPYSTYKVSVRVVDSDGKPIPGIDVKDGKSMRSLATSDQDGYAAGQYNSHEFTPELEFQNVVLKDNDGEANGGEFETLFVDVSERMVKVDDGDGWCQGVYEAELGEVTLQRTAEINN